MELQILSNGWKRYLERITGWRERKIRWDQRKYAIHYIVNQIFMYIFNKENEMIRNDNIPFKKLKSSLI